MDVLVDLAGEVIGRLVHLECLLVGGNVRAHDEGCEDGWCVVESEVRARSGGDNGDEDEGDEAAGAGTSFVVDDD
jgi:hypothetical protein